VLLSEQAGEARLVVYPFIDGQPAIKDVSVTGSLRRYDGARHPLRFTGSPPQFTSTGTIARPHVFDATIAVTIAGRPASFTYSQADGAIDLNAEQIKTSRIDISHAGPARIENRVRLPGEIRLDEDRTAHIAPRVAGIVERVAVSIGQTVVQGQLL